MSSSTRRRLRASEARSTTTTTTTSTSTTTTTSSSKRSVHTQSTVALALPSSSTFSGSAVGRSSRAPRPGDVGYGAYRAAAAAAAAAVPQGCKEFRDQVEDAVHHSFILARDPAVDPATRDRVAVRAQRILRAAAEARASHPNGSSATPTPPPSVPSESGV